MLADYAVQKILPIPHSQRETKVIELVTGSNLPYFEDKVTLKGWLLAVASVDLVRLVN